MKKLNEKKNALQTKSNCCIRKKFRLKLDGKHLPKRHRRKNDI